MNSNKLSHDELALNLKECVRAQLQAHGKEPLIRAYHPITLNVEMVEQVIAALAQQAQAQVVKALTYCNVRHDAYTTCPDCAQQAQPSWKCYCGKYGLDEGSVIGPDDERHSPNECVVRAQQAQPECEHGNWLQDVAANTITCSQCGKVE